MSFKAVISTAKEASAHIENFDMVAGITGTFLYWRTANLVGLIAGAVAYFATINQSVIEILHSFRPSPTLLVVFIVTQSWSLLWHAVAMAIHSNARMGVIVEYFLRLFVWLCLLGFGSILLSIFEHDSSAVTMGLKVWISVAYVFMEGFIYTLPALFGSKMRFMRWLQTIEVGLRGGVKAITALSSIREEAEKGFGRLGNDDKEKLEE